MNGQTLETQIHEAVDCDWGSSFETIMNSEEQACCFSIQEIYKDEAGSGTGKTVCSKRRALKLEK